MFSPYHPKLLRKGPPPYMNKIKCKPRLQDVNLKVVAAYPRCDMPKSEKGLLSTEVFRLSNPALEVAFCNSADCYSLMIKARLCGV